MVTISSIKLLLLMVFSPTGSAVCNSVMERSNDTAPLRDAIAPKHNTTAAEIYYYHTDHLGSSAWITDSVGTAIQHLHYLPWGEPYVTQKTGNFNPTYTFSGKERDEETGYSYFGQRFYDSQLSIWPSADPMRGKYPSLTPFAYCANNPIKLIDPNGESIEITGDDASSALEQLNNSTNLKLSFGKDGKTIEIIGGKVRNRADRLLKRAINDENITVNIEAKKENLFISHDGGTITVENGGGYDGNNIVDGKVFTFQKVIPNTLDKMDNDVDKKSSGGYMLHETAESYYGGLKAKRKGVSSPREGMPGSTYLYSHKRANRISGGEYTKVTRIEFLRDIHGNIIRNKYTGEPIKQEQQSYSRYDY